MKDIRIFIASSKELILERNELAFLVLAKEDEFAQRGLRVRLAKWEYVDPRMTVGRTEDRYLEEMYNCDAALVIFKNIAGMYTREELDKALAREAAGTDRIKTHKILFSTEGKPDSDAAKLRVSLPKEDYGVYANLEELKMAFLALVDEVSKSDRLVDAQDENLHEVSAFVAADDELASDRNAFADTILNLNDILARRGIRVRMRFYDPEHHRELLESSEMALVLYDTNFKAFSPDQMHDAYERTKRDENPKRLYVFFRDEDESNLDQEFVEFRNGFAENLGHFFCRFENADTLKLNFLLSLENALGDGAQFVKLDGKKIRADELEVGEITKLPMVANNGGLNSLMEQLDSIGADFKRQRDACQQDPDNDALYVALIKLSARKNELEKEVEKELSRTFDLAKRMAAVSAKEANETLAKARELLDKGCVEDAVALLDGASCELDDILGDIDSTVDILAAKLNTLEAWIDVEFFHADTVLAYAKEPIGIRAAKVEAIYKRMIAKAEKLLEVQRPKKLATIFLRFAKFYGKRHDALNAIPLLERAVVLYQTVELLHPGGCLFELAGALQLLADNNRSNEHPDVAEGCYLKALDILHKLGDRSLLETSECLHSLANLHAQDMNLPDKARKEYDEMLLIRRKMHVAAPSACADHLATSLRWSGKFYCWCGDVDAGKRLCEEALVMWRRLASESPGKYDGMLAASIVDVALCNHWKNRYNEAREMYVEALAVYRKLAQDDPDSYEIRLASLLKRKALLDSWMNDAVSSAQGYEESVAIYRRFAAAYPGKFDDDLSRALDELATVHMSTNDLKVAEGEYLEAVKIQRSLVAKNPLRYERELSNVLTHIGSLYEKVGRLDNSETLYREALIIQRRRVAANPKDVEGLFLVLYALSGVHNKLERFDESEEECAENLKIGRALAADDPDGYEHWLANALSRLGDLRIKQSRFAEAEIVYLEALSINQGLAVKFPERFDAEIAEALMCVADLHMRMERLSESEKELDQAHVIYRRLVDANPAVHEEMLAKALYQLAEVHAKGGKMQLALREHEEALELRRKLSEGAPDKFNTAVESSREAIDRVKRELERSS